MLNAENNLFALLHISEENKIKSRQYYEQLREAIAELIDHDFGKLVQLLYQTDVHEEKLKALLHNFPGTDADTIITNLLIERQLQKIKARASFKAPDSSTDEEERW